MAIPIINIPPVNLNAPYVTYLSFTFIFKDPDLGGFKRILTRGIANNNAILYGIMLF